MQRTCVEHTHTHTHTHCFSQRQSRGQRSPGLHAHNYHTHTHTHTHTHFSLSLRPEDDEVPSLSPSTVSTYTHTHTHTHTHLPIPLSLRPEDDEAPVSINCLRISFDSELQLLLYRHWSLHESLLHTVATACRFRVWTNNGRKRLQEFLADMGSVGAFGIGTVGSVGAFYFHSFVMWAQCLRLCDILKVPRGNGSVGAFHLQVPGTVIHLDCTPPIVVSVFCFVFPRFWWSRGAS